MAALEFFMIYAKAFRRGDGFYPLNAIFQDLMLLCICLLYTSRCV